MPVLVSVDARELIAHANLTRLAGAKTPTVLARALNHVGGRARTMVVRATAKNMGVAVGTARDNVGATKAHRSRLDFTIRARPGFLSLRSFSARQVRKGVTARPWGKRDLYASAFIVGKLGKQVFRRSTKGGLTYRVKRFRTDKATGRQTAYTSEMPIKKLFGPSVAIGMKRTKVVEAFRGFAEAELRKRVEHEIAYLLSQRARALRPVQDITIVDSMGRRMRF